VNNGWELRLRRRARGATGAAAGPGSGRWEGNIYALARLSITTYCDWSGGQAVAVLGI